MTFFTKANCKKGLKMMNDPWIFTEEDCDMTIMEYCRELTKYYYFSAQEIKDFVYYLMFTLNTQNRLYYWNSKLAEFLNNKRKQSK
jgi:hypothetical protein